MKNLSKVALLAAGAAIAPMPRAVFATPKADATDPSALIEQIQKAFAEFRETNDQTLEGKADDAIVNEKIGKIESSITDLTGALEQAQSDLAAARLGAGGDQSSPEAREHATAFNTFFRQGERHVDANLHELEINAGLTTQSDPDGGYLVPEEMENTIDRVVGTVSVMRDLSRVIQISGDTYKKLVSMGGATSGWVGEEDSRPETDTPILREIALEAGEIYANPAATQRLLDDARLDIAQWLADEVSIEFAEQEGEAFITGNGIKKPRGILAYDTVANASYAWGKAGFVKTGGAAAFAASDPADALIDLYYALNEKYRNGATFLTSDAVMGTVRKFKDGDGTYLWAPPTAADAPATVLGKPVRTDDNMPGLGANAFPVAFGNFQRAYTIADRFGIRVLRDPYTNKPFVHFYTTKRVGGGVTNFEAYKLLKCAA